MRLRKFDAAQQQFYIAWLNTLLKGQDYLALVYMTGILPIGRYGDGSLNMFSEYSMTDPGVFAPYMGFTEGDVEGLCERHGKGMDDYLRWYDGYRMTTQKTSPEGILCEDGVRRVFRSFHVFNPLSVVRALTEGDIKDYWDKTGQFAALKEYIETDSLGVRTSILEMMEGGRIPLNIRSFTNDVTQFKSGDDFLTMLVHLGYLTYDARTKEAFIPNLEVKLEFEEA